MNKNEKNNASKKQGSTYLVSRIPLSPLSSLSVGLGILNLASRDQGSSSNYKKNILFTGPRGSGETKLIEHLSNGEENYFYLKTSRGVQVIVTCDNWSFDDESDVGVLKDKIDHSDLVVYVVNADAFNGNDERYKRLKNDFYHMGKQAVLKSFKVIFVVALLKDKKENSAGSNESLGFLSEIKNIPYYYKVVSHIPPSDMNLLTGVLCDEGDNYELIEGIMDLLRRNF
ncbi:hypothetical protein SAMN05660443_0626 [Marinospirillum celere]|uniref:Uncharacterized protein n=1 Tax=Marinospirillum celere TaxID=1122252 RepID=A0A1I1EI51_9GAMM|nr:hypothetical protein [Marinospirillum celere]SFB86805.1 hypothetical protein SAMN05660443_0626 [Marinospirillum celere]